MSNRFKPATFRRPGDFSRGAQSYLLRTVVRDLAKVAAMLEGIETHSPDEDKPFYRDVQAAVKAQGDRLQERADAYDPDQSQPGNERGQGADAAPQPLEP